MNGFLTVAIAHDATCKPGEEWLFHGMAKPFDVHGSLESPLDPKDKERMDRDMAELRKQHGKEDETNEVERAKLGCALVLVAAFIFLLSLPIGISYLIERIMP